MLPNHVRSSLEWALMVAMVFSAGAFAQAQDQDADSDGRIIQISPATGDEAAPKLNQGEDAAGASDPDGNGFGQPPALPQHWIGVLGGPVTHDVRAQIDIPADQGVLVRDLVPESPAAKAGLKKYDILLRANDVDLRDMRDLAELVSSEGERGGQITLEVLRGGQRETVWVTPEERPEHVTRDFTLRPEAGRSPQGDLLEFFNERLPGGQGGPFQFRMFGPGAVAGGQPFGMAGIPSGVSVTIQKQNDEPAQVTVQRGEETWEIVGDDPASLEQLPEDLRPFVERMLGPPSGTFTFTPRMPAMPVMPALPHGEQFPDLEQMQQQLETVQQQMRELEQRLFGPEASQQEQAE